jgi:Tol biopolymer transport system component
MNRATPVALLTVAVVASAVAATQNPAVELFGAGVLSTELDELNAAFSPDGRELYFTINAPENRIGVIVMARRRGDGWTAAEVAPFSGRYTDYDPFFSADGSKLFFVSNRPAGPADSTSDFDVWMVERSGDRWGSPTNLGAPVNTARDEFYPSVAADGTIYFSANRDGGQGSFDVWKSRLVDGRYQEPENLGPNVNQRTAEIDNYVAPDQSFLVFAGYGRPDDMGRGDLYISYFANGAWTPAKHLGPGINSSAREYCPIGSPDGRWLYWTSKRGFADRPMARALTVAELRDSLSSVRNGQGNVYRVPIAVMHAAGR